MRIVRFLLGFLLVVALVLLVGGVWIVRRSFPVTTGEVALPGMVDVARVVRDAGGVPHITASNTNDLLMAQGYVHAQDRFWQMDTWRHIGAGRLAEMFGGGQVETDSFLRTLGFEQAAAEAYRTMGDESRAALDAYAAGVNAYLAERPGGSALSLEYAVLGLQNSDYRPAEWEPDHSLIWGHVMAWDLRANLEDEIERAMVSSRLSAEHAEDLFPPFPDGHTPIVPGDEATTARVQPDLPPESAPAFVRAGHNVGTAFETLGPAFAGLGSNSWVVGGSRTDSGLPLLANDPHLGIQIPSIWYQATLWCEQVNSDCPYRVSGLTFPGAPGVVVGHNERIAWGVTNEGPDTMDLFLEEVDDGRYRVGDGWEPLEVRTETIEVAGGEDVALEIRATRHGPIISGRYGPVDTGVTEDGYEVALAWQALEPATIFEALLGINRAQNWDEFRQAAAQFDIAPQNLIYADVEGHIGYQATGEIPIRANGDGRYPVPGWTSEFHWVGLIPFEELPSMLDPASDLIVAANQPVIEPSESIFIGVDHDRGYRAERIRLLLEQASGPLNAEAMAEMQMDAYDASAEVVVPTILDLEGGDATLGEMQDVLRPWAEGTRPFRMEASSPGAAAYAAIWRHLLAETFDELPEEFPARGNSRYFALITRLLADPANEWWDVQATPETETRDDILRRAVTAAHAELTDLLGDDQSDWEWGKLHVPVFEHQTLGQSGLAPIERLFNRVGPGVGGGSSIVNATGWDASAGYEVLALPSFRMVIDLSDLEATRAIHATGQSGHAFHGHYFDMADEWAGGNLRPMRFGEPGAGDVLELVPAG